MFELVLIALLSVVVVIGSPSGTDHLPQKPEVRGAAK